MSAQVLGDDSQTRQGGFKRRVRHVKIYVMLPTRQNGDLRKIAAMLPIRNMRASGDLLSATTMARLRPALHASVATARLRRKLTPLFDRSQEPRCDIAAGCSKRTGNVP